MRQITAYNSLTRKKEILEPSNPPYLNIYTCGPTVYDHSHIGHARASITWDFIVRFLRYAGYQTVWTRNITDIDDKIINKARELNLHPDKVARIYAHSFHEDMHALNVDWPDFEPAATQHIPDMINFIQGLIQNGSAYQIKNDIYFSVPSFKNYGRLKGQSISELEKGFGRIEPNPQKKHSLDFALWKGIKDSNDYGFESPWGKGRPGWHLECSTMNYALYRTNLDIHGGGDDLIFPHHENEIAQSESFTKLKFAKYWLHNGMIMVNGKKMAKSEGNFITIKDALKNTSGNALRFFMLNSHYRMPVNYTDEGIIAAQNGVNRITEALSDFNSSTNDIADTENEYTGEFIGSMSDDFNSPQALAVLFKLTDNINKEANQKIKIKLKSILYNLSCTLGFNLSSSFQAGTGDKLISKIIDGLIIWRKECKLKKDFASGDKIRDILNDSNIEIKDLPDDRYKWQIRY
ncbi:MAG: cysteine--tRNA ligase [Candidatus Melainabacteria bacterium RIFCSPLOWO2_02_FULL_35_15]|nr:MAG: cysteine--tRNA ligase [Candidatus Melainabacteria bacterium RIFCSPLOWO2_12_FULL_35_11]OGI13945.1 MAG: cysteine--tRNA ligase [Candidatus Melainabacteria bacterium RIFCSPLOWO2_02_FULL_35_15]